MLGLKMKTDPRWVKIAEKNLQEILTDHAFCEQKAASTAISFIVAYPEYTELVEAMISLAKEEMEHFQMVHKILIQRGYILGRERKDPYVHDLKKFFVKSEDKKINLVQRLLVGAMIEARSCERFRILSENIKDKELSKFYFKLMKSEANHYTMFLKFAKRYAKESMNVNEVWNNFLKYESEMIQNYGKKEFIHG